MFNTKTPNISAFLNLVPGKSNEPRLKPLNLLPLYLINYLLHKLTSQTKP